MATGSQERYQISIVFIIVKVKNISRAP